MTILLLSLRWPRLLIMNLLRLCSNCWETFLSCRQKLVLIFTKVWHCGSISYFLQMWCWSLYFCVTLVTRLKKADSSNKRVEKTQKRIPWQKNKTKKKSSPVVIVCVMRHHTTTTWLLLPTANDNGTKTSDYLSGKYSDGAKEHWVNTKKKKK